MISKNWIAKKIEVITDDDDNLSSLCIWLDVGGYIALAREMDSDDIECEFSDQVNGFIPSKIEYTINKTFLSIKLGNEEYFEKNERFQELTIAIPEDMINMEELEQCLVSIFHLQHPPKA